MTQRDKRTTLLLKAGKTLIDSGDTGAARLVLETLDDPMASKWLQSLDRPRQSFSRYLWGGIFFVILIFFAAGFGIGRASAPAPDNDLNTLFNEDDYAMATSQVEGAHTQQAVIEATNVELEDFFAQTQTAAIVTATHSALATESARATRRADQTATESANNQ